MWMFCLKFCLKFCLIESCASREVDLDSLASANNGSHEVYLRLSCPVFDDELS